MSWNTITSSRLVVLLITLITLSLFIKDVAGGFEFENDETTTISSKASPMRRTYTNEWAVRIAGGKNEDADRLAAKYGYANLGPVSRFI